MQPTETPESNRTPEVEPAIRHTVPWRVTSVAALLDFRLRVTFVDGVTGDVDMRLFLSAHRIDRTVFEPLRDPAVFAQPRVLLGADSMAKRRRHRPGMPCMMRFANMALGAGLTMAFDHNPGICKPAFARMTTGRRTCILRF
jgi:Protein of unknown function (DUF2442)